jgi:alpha-L-arabinofuranosidase
MIKVNWKNLFAAASLAAAVSTNAQPAQISVAVDHPGHAISPTLWGVFFEDINLSADGGIYPELVRNRSFEDADKPENWQFTATGNAGEASICTANVQARPSVPPLNAFNRKSLRIKAAGAFTLANEGYWGMNVVAGDAYELKLAARVTDGFGVPLTVRLVSAEGKVLASGEVRGFNGSWKYFTTTLVPTESDSKAKLEIVGDGKGVIYLDMVSLLPAKTWKNHGLRVDLAESVAALHPKFLRFPGGCWVEGDDFEHMNHWKNTVGNIDTRTPLWNIWGYYATHGLGYHEYLQLAEDLGAESLYDINVGMSHKEVVPMDRMEQWVQDALDAVEYANGPTNSVWGAKRAKAGHPAPFNLKYMEIGNENGGDAYRERWPLFVQAIHAKYPEIKFIANHWAGGYPSTPKADVVDEHFYDSPEWFMRHANHFDKYDRNGPKIFVGEYAVTKECGLGNLRGAIGEAAFMTGLERNSDHVIMASYAPLLVNLNRRAWNPDLINFDTHRWYGLPSYYVQQLFAENRGDVYLPTEVQSPMADIAPDQGMIGVGTWNTAAEFKDIKVTTPDGKVLLTSDFSQDTKGWNLLGGGDWTVQDGALRQTAEKEFIRALAGKLEWTDYTLTLKARKISGAEGFLILFRINGNEGRTWWNIGGWGNTADGIEAGETLDSKPSRIETDRWYDLKVEVKGKHVKCSLDGRVIHDLDYGAGGKVASLYASSATDAATGDIIVKVANANAGPLETDVLLNGASKLTGKGTVKVLTSDSGTDENTIEEPTKVSPKSEAFEFAGNRLKCTFPGNSFTVLRIPTK